MRLSPRFPILVVLLACVNGCNREPALGTGDAGSDHAAGIAASTMDERALRNAISTAIREQRLYAPAGNNAIEWYLQLRNRLPDDRETNNALMEMEPYAVIAAEQSLSRQEFDEAQRLIELIERANGNASALQRLRDQLARQRALPVSPVEVLVAETTIEPAKGTALLPAEPAKILPPPTTSVPTDSTITDGRVASPKAPALEPAPTPVAILPTPTSSPTAAVAQPRTEARTPAQLRDRNPRYPPMALNRKIEGSVELAFTIKADGSVSDVRVLSANPPGIFEDAAIATTRHWQFEALGRDVPSRRSIYFNLPKQAP